MSFDRAPWARNFFRTTSSLLLSATLVLSANGCKAGSASGSSSGSSSSRSSGSSGGDSGSSGGSGSDSAKGGGQGQGKSGGSGGEQLSEPVDSTTGQATAESDDGSPRAVGHTSTSMPGAPQATLKGSQQDKKLDSPESQNAPKANAQPGPQ